MPLKIMRFPTSKEQFEEFGGPFSNLGIFRRHVGDERRDQLRCWRVQNDEPDRCWDKRSACWGMWSKQWKGDSPSHNDVQK